MTNTIKPEVPKHKPPVESSSLLLVNRKEWDVPMLDKLPNGAVALMMSRVQVSEN